MVQLFKNIFAFIGVKFQNYCKKFDSLLSIFRFFTFSVIQEYHFNDHFVRFQHFGLRYHILRVVCKYQSWFRVNQRWISAVQGWKSNVSELRKSALNSADSELLLSETALIQRKSELISSETELISADVYHVLWISAEKRQNYETALFSADYLWDFNPSKLLFAALFTENTNRLAPFYKLFLNIKS